MSRDAAPELVLGKAYDVRLLKRLWPYVKPHLGLLVLALVISPLAIGFELTLPYLLKLAIDGPMSNFTTDGLAPIALAYVFFVVLGMLSGFAQQYLLQLVGQRSMHDLRTSTYQHVVEQRAAYFDKVPVGRLLTRMTSDIEAINEMFASGVITMVFDFVKLLAIVCVLIVLNAKLTLFAFAALPIVVLLVAYARRLMRSSFREIRVKLAQMNAFLQEYLSGIRVVQLFRRERRALADYDQINAQYRDAYFDAIRADASMYAGVEAVGAISVACIAWYASGNVADGVLTVGLVIAFIEYIQKFYVPVRDMSAKYTVMQSAMAAAERIIGLLDTHEPDAPPPTQRHDVKPEHRDAAVAFDNVHFAYRPGEPILKGITLEVAQGQTVAVVGATGSGKSTLTKLLTRLYEPQTGSISLAGTEVRDLDVKQLRRRVTVVSQDVFLFAGTIADNVRLGDAHATDDDVRQALHRVGATAMLARRGTGLDTPVEARGANFSAGERQLVAFARALVRKPDLLILDEATAHVDPEVEGWIENGLKALMENRTTLVIAHRLSTIRHADQIVVLAGGRVAESGTHDQLMAQGGRYALLERTFSRS